MYVFPWRVTYSWATYCKQCKEAWKIICKHHLNSNTWANWTHKWWALSWQNSSIGIGKASTVQSHGHGFQTRSSQDLLGLISPNLQYRSKVSYHPRARRVSSRETSVSSRETSLSPLEMRVLSLETRLSSHETVRKNVKCLHKKNVLKINMFMKTLALQNITLDPKVLGQNAVGGGVLLSLRVNICSWNLHTCTLNQTWFWEVGGGVFIVFACQHLNLKSARKFLHTLYFDSKLLI